MNDLIKYGLPLILLMAIPFFIINLTNYRLGGIGIGLMTAAAASYYFHLENPHAAYKKHVIVLLFVWVVSIHLSKYFEIGTLLPALLSGALAYSYFLRTKARTDRHWVDYLKLIGVFLLVPSTYFFSGVVAMIIFYLGCVFLLDRLIIRRQMNKTTQIIAFCFLALMSLSFLIYSFIKADEAEKSSEEARVYQKEAEALRDEAVSLMEMAQEAVAEAKKQEAISLELKEALEACKNQ